MEIRINPKVLFEISKRFGDFCMFLWHQRRFLHYVHNYRLEMTEVHDLMPEEHEKDSRV